MNDSPMAMATFTRQMKAELRGQILCERHAFVDQPFNGRTPVFHDEPCGRLVAQATTGDQRIAHVVVDTVGRVEHGRNTTLSPVAGALAYAALGENGNAPRVRQIQRHAQARQPAADDCHVEIHPATSPSILSAATFRIHAGGMGKAWSVRITRGTLRGHLAVRPVGRTGRAQARADEAPNRYAKAKSLA